MIPFQELIVKEKLGEGANSVVYHGFFSFALLTNSIYKEKDVALKRMKKIPSVVESRYLLREFQMQMRFKHECILEIYGHSEDPSGFKSPEGFVIISVWYNVVFDLSCFEPAIFVAEL